MSLALFGLSLADWAMWFLELVLIGLAFAIVYFGVRVVRNILEQRRDARDFQTIRIERQAWRDR